MVAETRKTVTLKMIAELAHCSISSVSTVLNHAHGNSVVSGATRKRILAIADELGYHPNFASRSLRTQHTQMIGVYVQPKKWASLGNSYELLIFKGIEAMARECNYKVMILNFGLDVQPESCSAQILEKRVDGVILIHTDRAVAEELATRHRHIVAADCAHASKKINQVMFDDVGAVAMAVRYLIGLGHTRIGYAGACTEEKRHSSPREAYFRNALRQNGLKVNDALIFNETKCTQAISYEDRFCQAEGEAALDYFRGLAQPPTAVVTYNSLVGAAFLHEAQKFGVRIPEEISVVGIDDYEFLDYIEPRLTVVDRVLMDIGKASAAMLIDLIEGRQQPPASVFLEPVMKEGTSTAAINSISK